VLYCSTTMWAFGPIFKDRDEAEEFLDWPKVDPRSLADNQLETKYAVFLVRTKEDEPEEIEE
jgi:hypothetical protein